MTVLKCAGLGLQPGGLCRAGGILAVPQKDRGALFGGGGLHFLVLAHLILGEPDEEALFPLEKGIKAEGGLYMLVMQAVVAVERFLDIKIEKSRADSVFASVFASKENLVLTGMPGSGKSTTGKLIDIDGFEFIDTDDEIEKKCGVSTKQLIDTKGEKYFRDIESEVIREVSLESGRIISTGGGAILRQENIDCLKLNGLLFYIDAKLENLCATDSRPLSDTDEKLKKLYQERLALYKQAADVIVPYMATAKDQAEYITKKRLENVQ